MNQGCNIERFRLMLKIGLLKVKSNLSQTELPGSKKINITNIRKHIDFITFIGVLIGFIMKYFVLAGIMFLSTGIFAQTNSLSTGNWSDGTIWSTGAVPLATATVNVNNTITIDQNIVVTTGTFNFGQAGAPDEFITDTPGGTAYTLTATTSGGVLNFLDGITTFEGIASLDNISLVIESGATLIVGGILINNNTNINVKSGGTLIVNGDFNNLNNGGGVFIIGGLIQVNGNYNANVGSVELTGAGDIYTTGSINTTGSSEIFGSRTDCGSGPCSGRNLCGYSLTISPSQVLCIGSTPTVLTSATNATGTKTYRWQRSGTVAGFGNGTTGSPPLSNQSPAAGTNTNSTYTIDPTYYAGAGDDYFRLYMYDSNTGCGAFSNVVQLTMVAAAGGAGSWLGTTSSDWHDPLNWCGTVPTNTTPTTVTISTLPAGVAFSPVISAVADVRNLTIESGALVTLSGASTLNIYGNLTTDGVLTAGAASTVALVGPRVQTIGGNNFALFGNLTINNTFATIPNIIFNTNNKAVSGTLNLTNGIVNLNGYTLTVGTSAASTGSLSRTNGWFYNGNLQRYFGTAATSLANGLFPLGLSTTDYRPFALGYTSAITTGGYIRVSHTGTQYTFIDPTDFFDNPPTNTISVQRTSVSRWTTSRSGMTTTPVGALRFTIEAGGTSFSDPAVLTDFRLTLANSVVGTNGTTSGTAMDPRIQRTGLTAAQLSNTFYVGTINAIATPLPISLLSFTATRKENGVDLLWKTLSEENLDYFEVERSTNGKDFLSLGKVKGNGTTNEQHEYRLFDEKVLLGKNYYRLKSVDFDGYTEYFNVVMVDFDGKKSFSVHPNPSDGVSFTAETNFIPQNRAFIAIYSTIGSEIARYEISGEVSTITLPVKLESGVYYAKYISLDFNSTNRVLVK